MDHITRAVAAVECVGGNTLVQLPLSATDQMRIAGSFAVPPGCPAQALTIAAPAGLGDASRGVTVDQLTVTPTGPSLQSAQQHRPE